MIDHAVDCFGRLDCLVNNAGRGSQFATIADVDLEQFDAVIAVHLRAVLAGMKYAALVMAVQGMGSIINVASVNGMRAGLGGHYYSAAKAAAIHLTPQKQSSGHSSSNRSELSFHRSKTSMTLLLRLASDENAGSW